MLEIPEAAAVAGQMDDKLAGLRVRRVEAGRSPHKFAWFYGDPAAYDALLAEHTVTGARPVAGYVRLELDGPTLTFGEGVRLSWLAPGEKRPEKHQLLVEFEDDSALICSVQMYGGMWAHTGEFDNPYYRLAAEKPNPLTDAFDRKYFDTLAPGGEKLSAKAFLATEQRVPGLGNGVLQDILFNARIHPKKKLGQFAAGDMDTLYRSVKDTLAQMTAKGGRDNERDLFGCPGGYKTILNAKSAGGPCPVCGDTIVKQAYMGGSVYFCPTCQPL